MSLRALGSLLTRRFSPRAHAQALGTRGSTAGRPARFLHSSSLAVGGAAIAAAASSGGFAFLYLKKDTDESACKVIGDEKARKEVTGMKPGKIISDEVCDDRKAEHEATGGISPPDEEFYEFLKSRPEFINYHKGLAGNKA